MYMYYCNGLCVRQRFNTKAPTKHPRRDSSTLSNLNNLSGGPLHLAAAKNVQMQVVHRLACSHKQSKHARPRGAKLPAALDLDSLWSPWEMPSLPPPHPGKNVTALGPFERPFDCKAPFQRNC